MLQYYGKSTINQYLQHQSGFSTIFQSKRPPPPSLRQFMSVSWIYMSICVNLFVSVKRNPIFPIPRTTKRGAKEVVWDKFDASKLSITH